MSKFDRAIGVAHRCVGLEQLGNFLALTAGELEEYQFQVIPMGHAQSAQGVDEQGRVSLDPVYVVAVSGYKRAVEQAQGPFPPPRN